MKSLTSTLKTTLLVTSMAASMVTLLGACAPVLLGGALLGGGMVASDRRTSGTQLEDEGIELRSASRLHDAFTPDARVSVTSYNRQVLITGEVPTEQDKLKAADIVSKVDNVRSVVNELGVMGKSTLPQRSSDSLVSGRVKAALVDANDLSSNAFKVVTERGTTYLLGRVTQREAARATDVVRGVPGVQRVVRVLEIIGEQELQSTPTHSTATHSTSAQSTPATAK